MCYTLYMPTAYDPPEDIGSFEMGFDYSVWSPILRGVPDERRVGSGVPRRRVV